MPGRPTVYIAIAVLLLSLAGAAGCAPANGSSSPVGSVTSVSSTEAATETGAGGSASSETDTTTSRTPTSDTATTHAGEDTPGAGYTATGTTFESDTASISISKVSTGSGNDTVTYYVADVQLQPGALLQAGLADGFQQGNVDYTSSIAEANNAILAINGDYCTGRNTGVIIRNGVLYLDNPTREGLALYTDGTMKVYDEAEVSAEQLLADGVYNTYSFGPPLLVDGETRAGLDTTEVEDIGEKHTILGYQPRTGIGIIAAGHYVFVVVDGRSPGYSRGVALSEFAQIFKDLGCTTAYNLDGGGSSAMYFMGELVNNPLGKGRERGISDILYVG